MKKWLYYIFSNVDFVFLLAIIFFKLALFAKYVDLYFLNETTMKVSIGTILVLASWLFLLSGKARLMTGYILNIILTLIIFSDLVYYRYFGDFITIPVLLQAKQVSSLGGSIVNLIEFKDILFFIDLLVYIPILIFLKGKKLQTFHWGWRAALTALSVSLGLLLVFLPINQYIEKYGKNLFINSWSNVSIYSQTGQIGFHLLDANKYVTEHVLDKKQLTVEAASIIDDWFFEHNQKLQQETPFYGVATGKNILMIQLESFQNYVIHAKVNGEEITPNLNALANETMYFSNFYQQVAQGRTSDAEFLANNSLYPLPTGSVYVRYPANEFHSLPKILKKEGYFTAAFHSYMKNFWNRNLMYQTYEFDEFIGRDDFQDGEKIGPFGSLGSIGDKDVFEQTIHYVKDKQPFYGFVVALTSHHPYSNIPQRYRTLDLGPYESDIFGDYLHSVHYVDYAIGELVKQMKAEGLWDSTVVVMYGDHDSGVPLDDDMARFLHIDLDDLQAEEILHEVPLFVHIPNNNQVGTYEQTAGMIDLTPSLLHLMGIDVSDKNYMGNNIFALENHIVGFRYGSFSNGEVFYKASKDMVFENGTCYDLKSRDVVDIQLCKPGFEEINQQLNISDNVIYHNLLKNK